MILLIVLGFFPLHVCGQNFLSGRVIDATSEKPLSDALVLVEGSRNGATTDASGNFRISGIQRARPVIHVSYQGYEELRIQADSAQGFLIVRLTPSDNRLREVVVDGIAGKQIRALVAMKRADNIVNVVSAEQILTFPDLNAAEVLQRVPGITLQRDQGEGRFVQLRGTPPQFTNFTINGEQVSSPEGGYRYIGLDIIPADQISSIEVAKVLTPDMDGDAIGGTINVITKLRSNDSAHLSTTFSGGYNSMRRAPVYNFQFAYGSRYKKLSIQLNGSYFENNQGSENIEYKFMKGPFYGSQGQGQDNYYLHYREVQLRHYSIQRKRISVSPGLALDLDNNTRFYLKTMFNRFVDDEVRRRLIYDLEDPVSADFYLYGGIKHDLKSRIKYQDLSTFSLGGEHDLKKWNIDYQLFYSMAGEEEPDRIEASFENPGKAISIQFEEFETDYRRASFPVADNSDNAFDYRNYNFDFLLFEESQVRERLFTPRINFKYTYSHKADRIGFVKFGAKIRSRTKSRDVLSNQLGSYRVSSAIYPGTGDTLRLTDISSGFSERDLLKQGYVLEQMPDAGKLADFFEFNRQYFIIDRNSTRKNTYNSDYNYSENIYAAYVMARQRINRLMVLGGLRWEVTDVIRNQGMAVILDGNKFVQLDTLNLRRSQSFLLPQIQIKYALTPKLNLRFATTVTYSRPNYSDLIPSREEDRNEVSIGNPNLNYPRSTNIDLMLERYYGQSIFSAGLFYKGIDDFVFSYKRFGREGEPGSGNYPVFEFTKPVNGQNATILGLEVQAQFKFDFTRGFLSRLGLFSNYTFTGSRAFIPKRVPANYAEAIIIDPVADDLSVFFETDGREQIKLPGQAAHAANVGFFYDWKRTFVRLSGNYQSDFLVFIGPDADFDAYYDAALRLDLTLNFQLRSGINLFADVMNLTDTPLRYYSGDPDTIQKLEYYAWWTKFGIRLNL
ncbi:MAG: TonB-dependent receptor [Flavobacteriales bacterium]|nr:TonB-dependent receptor [Flavobacteriales bacterium]